MSKTVRRQSVVSFSLSFLDILCCGLGAAVLLLLVVKYGETIAETDAAGLLIAHITEIQELIATKQEEKSELERLADESQNEILAKTAQDDAKASVSRQQASRLASLLQQVQQQRAALNEAQRQLASTAAENAQQAQAATEDSSRQHLTGLLVNDDRVVVLLDASASMLNTTLVEIIRMRVAPESIRQQAAKWVSARGAADWVLDELPDSAFFQVLTFSDTIQDARGQTVSTANPPPWESKSDPTLATAKVSTTLAQRIPHGPTDLKSALQTVEAMKPLPAQIVLITDGYPTVPGKTALGRLRQCPRARAGQVPLLSPQCRLSVFKNAEAFALRELRGVRIDAILLPLEGDSNSVLGYWEFTAKFGGRLLAPVAGWPSS